MQRNSNNIDEELNRKYEEVNGLKDENEELIEEVERLREDLEKAHANNEKHRRRKYNTFEVSLSKKNDRPFSYNNRLSFNWPVLML